MYEKQTDSNIFHYIHYISSYLRTASVFPLTICRGKGLDNALSKNTHKYREFPLFQRKKKKQHPLSCFK